MVKRTGYLLLGSFSLMLAIIGVFLPLLPTTPLVLLAAYFYSRSSQRLYQRLLSHSLFGPIIRDWEAEGAIPLKIKWLSSSMMLLMISYPVCVKQLPLWMDISMLSLIAVGMLYIWTRPTSRG